MKKYEEKKFDISELIGISQKNILEHLKLYSGYVKNTNSVLEQIQELSLDAQKNSYLIAELTRRFSFEYNGMRNHEIYFDSLSSGSKEIKQDSDLNKKITDTFGSVNIFIDKFKSIAMTRGVGWAILWYDQKDDILMINWVDEQHIGQLNECKMILALDMWEHAYVYDYPTSEKIKYIESFFQNLNWEKIEENYKKAKNS